MKVALSFLAYLLVANAAVLPQNGLGVTEDEIDTLVRDAALAYRTQLKETEPVRIGSDEIPISIEGLKINTIDTKLWIGETLKYSESSSLSDESLGVSIEIVQKNAKAKAGLHVTGTSQGKQVDQTGKLEILLSTIGQITTITAETKPNFALSDFDSTPEIGEIVVSVTGIKIDGVSNSELESAIAESVQTSLEKTPKKMSPDDLEALNKLIGKHSLQEVYEYLRKTVPSS